MPLTVSSDVAGIAVTNVASRRSDASRATTSSTPARPASDGYESSMARSGAPEKAAKPSGSLPAKALAPVSDELTMIRAGKMLAHSFWAASPFGGTPVARLDVDSGGRVSGWIQPVNNDPSTRVELTGTSNYSQLLDTRSNPAPFSIETSSGRPIVGKVFVYADGEIALELKLPGLAKLPGSNRPAVLRTEPSLPLANGSLRSLVKGPLFGQNWAGAYGFPSRLVFDLDGSAKGWVLAYNEIEDIHREDVRGRWTLRGDTVECEVFSRTAGQAKLRGRVHADGVDFDTEGSFAKMGRVENPEAFFDA